MTRREAALDAGLEARIRTIRTHRVMLDRDLAELYGVSTGAVNQAVSRKPWPQTPDGPPLGAGRWTQGDGWRWEV